MKRAEPLQVVRQECDQRPHPADVRLARSLKANRLPTDSWFVDVNHLRLASQRLRAPVGR
jgi:hypothetical protein